uniref:Uncharacterized protein n=1 Tax=Anguilla anguilla TaxID=7936 RepID=A0A0E9R8T7_ANGAN
MLFVFHNNLTIVWKMLTCLFSRSRLCVQGFRG